MSAAGGLRRVLVCEDSKTFGAGLTRLLEHGGEIEVVALCGSGEAALALLPELQPDLVTMDIELPGMSGLEAVEEIMSTRPTPILVLSSHVGPRSSSAVAALAAGALEVLHKDTLAVREPEAASAQVFRDRVKLLSTARVIRHPRARLNGTRRLQADPGTQEARSVIGLCASTGGPQALATILSSLPESFRLPILIVQHITPGFTEGLVRWLDNTIALPVCLASDEVAPTRGVWIAPDGAHLVLGPDGVLALDRETVSGLHRPSADVLLASLARAAGPRALGVVLTGMGRDGALGVRALRAAGATVIAQDAASSAVYGMPKAALDEGADPVLPLAEIAGSLSSWALAAGRR